MQEQKFTVYGIHKNKIDGIIWLPEESPKAILQITHGMTEHIYRYKSLAKALTLAGIAVAGFDLPGHGRNLGSSGCASFGETGWENALNDIHEFSIYLENKYVDVPRYLLGFSLGSFLVREYFNKFHHGFSGAIIAGTGDQPAAVLSIMMAIVKTQIKSHGFDHTTPLVKKLSFETYNSKFKPNHTDFDWLCSDESQLNSYINDTLCANSISSGLFWQLLNSMKYTGRKEAYANWNKSLPVLLLSGGKDPVGDSGAGVKRVARTMKQAGITNVDMHLLGKARHDIFHESESGVADQVPELIINWISK